MKKLNLILTLLLLSLLTGTMAFAQALTVRLGADYVELTDDRDEDFKYEGHQLTGKVWFADLPQLSITGSCTNLDAKTGDTTEYNEIDYAVTGEYRIHNETNYGFTLTAGWLSEGRAVGDEERTTDYSYLTLGGKGNYVLTDGLQTIADVSYASNAPFKDEHDADMSILRAKVGAELQPTPELKFSAFYLYNKYTVKIDELNLYDDFITSGFNVGASYAFSF
jgi:hypothetical protein